MISSYTGIQIEQQYAKLGMRAEKGQLSIKQPKATMELTITRPELDITSPRGELSIDQSKAWDALGVGSNLELMSRVYAQAKQLGIEGIGRIAEKGNQLAAIHQGGDPIASMAQQEAFRDLPINYVTTASSGNVDISYNAQKPNIQAIRGNVELFSQKNGPDINYTRGRIQYEMLQHASINITPPQWDMRI